ncbi:MAG TPA: GMC family oxidoreductase [Noviherbaspirillum sp.]|nr:GMC family oxidoreductase [Noviherbaspirillum sp.]
MVEREFDVVIVGSGAGGSPVADTLVRAGKRVLILEKGPLLYTQAQSPRGLSDFKRDELFSTGAEKRLAFPDAANNGESYFSSHVEPDLNDEPHVYMVEPGRDHVTIEGYTAQVVGGGTQLYGAVSLRFSELDFRLGSFNSSRTDLKDDPNGDVRRESRDWPISYADLEPYYAQAEEFIGINGQHDNQLKPFSRQTYQQPINPNPISTFAKAGMDRLGTRLKNADVVVKPYRTPLAVITEDHPRSGRKKGDPATSYVNRYGDPLGLKSSTWVSLLHPLTALQNFELRPNCNVTHLEAGNDGGGRKVTRVNYVKPNGEADWVRGKVVVLACSAIETVRLLLLSAESNDEFAKGILQNDLVGKYFLTHCFGGAETVMPGRFDKSIALDSDWAIDCCATEDFLRASGIWAGGAIYNNTSDQALPISMARTHGSQDLDTIWDAFESDWRLTGEGLVKLFDDNLGRRLSVSFMANQVPVKANRIELHPSIRDKWGRKAAYIIKDWHPHDRYLMKVLAERCREILAWGGDPAQGNWPVEGFGSVDMAPNARARIANHILGGARFGTNPGDSVLDPTCRAWHFDNLFITDGCFMPTSGGANPTLTIQANAFRVADILLREGRV